MLGLVLAGSFGLATAWNGDSFLIPVLVAATALLSIRTDQVSAGLFSLLPACVALLGIVPVSGAPGTVALVAAIGFAYAWAITTRLAFDVEPAPLSEAAATVHGTVLAVVAGLAAWATLAWDLPHGYWFILTLAVVLRPQPDEAVRYMGERLLGTLVGSLLAIVIVYVLPGALVTIALLGCGVFFFSYLLLRDYVRQTVFITAVVLTISAAGGGGTGLSISLQRVGWTVLAVLIAAAAYAIALTLVRERELRPPDPGVTGSRSRH